MAALTKQANDAYNDRIAAAKACQSALGKAQGDGIHNKSWWDHVAEDLSEWGGKIAEIANDLAPFLDVLALATSWIPGVDVVTAALAEADNIIALVGTGMQIAGDAMQGHWGDALMGVGMLGAQYLGGKMFEKFGGKLIEKIGARGNKLACEGGDPVDVVSGNVIANEVDLELPGTLPMALRRAYSSGNFAGRLLGAGWSSTLDQRIAVNGAGIHFAGDYAQILTYPVPAGDGSVLPTEGARWPLVWDRARDEIRVDNPWSGLSWHFDTVHHQSDDGQIRDLTAISDRNGNRITFVRDDVGTPLRIEHSGGYRIAVDTAATPAGVRVTGFKLRDEAAADGYVQIVEYRYDDRGRLVAVVNSSGLPYSYDFDDEDRIVAFTDRLGFRYTYEYDRQGRVLRATGAEGFLTASFTYAEEENTTVVTDSLGHPTTYRYDDHGHLVAVTDPLGGTVMSDYDRYGRLASRIDALGNRTSFEFDEGGDVVRVTDPDGAVTRFEYNGFHQPVLVQTADGPIWRRRYDERGNLTEVVEPGGATTRAERSDRGAITRGVDPAGSAVGYRCDAAGLPISVTDPLGGAIHAVRDAFGRVTAVTDATGATTRYQWTVEGFLAERTEPDGARSSWSYDAEGNEIRSVDAVGAVTVTEPGPFGRIAARTGPDGVRHEFTHDTELNLLSVTGPAGAIWHYGYDAAGRLVTEQDFAGRRLGYEYDAAGRMVARITGSGERIGFEYDAAGRLARRRTPDGDYTYGYDTEHRITSLSGPGSRVEYTWNDAGRLAAESTDGRRTAYEYDVAGRRVRRITPGGAVSEWSYDAAGQAETLRAGSHLLTFRLDAAGREVQRILPGARIDFAFDPAGRVEAQRVWAGDGPTERRQVVGREWRRRADGIPTEIHDSLRGVRRYETDPIGRVTAVTAQDWREEYAYDAFGQVTTPGVATPGDAAPTLQAVGDGGPAQARSRGGRRTSCEYDAAGRVTRTIRRTLDGRRIVRVFQWNSEDRLVETVAPDGTRWHYAYDPLGRRVSKARVSPEGAVVEQTVFVWDGPVLVEQHAHTADASVAVLTWDYDPGTGAPAAQRSRTSTAADLDLVDETFHAIVTDLAGTPTELLDDSGAIAWRTTTDLWGRMVAGSADAGADCPLRFAGQYFDAETELHYNLHRYYDPDTAAYLSPDPLGLVAGPNDHAYVPNPLVDTDPFGLMCDKALMKWSDETMDKATAYHDLHKGVDDWFHQNGTTAVVRARFPDGNGNWVVKDVVAHSGKETEEMAVALQSAAVKNGDIAVPFNVPGFTHAEHNALLFINKLGGVPVAGGASRPVCRDFCGPLIQGTKGTIYGQIIPKTHGHQVRGFFWSGSMNIK
ncbi:RHS repeat-associated protein [Catenulispora sp. GP43]